MNLTLWNNLATSYVITIQNAVTHAVLTTKSCTLTACSASFYTTAISLAYEVKVAPTSMSTSQAYPFYLVAKSYSGNTTYAGNPTEQVLAKLGDFLRSTYVGRLVYFSAPTKINVSIQPV